MFYNRFKLVFTIALFFVSFSSKGQNSKDLNCNQHKLSDFVTAMDTTACGFIFEVIDKDNRPLNNVEIRILKKEQKLENDSIILIPSEINTKTNTKGNAYTDLFHANKELEVYISREDQVYNFKFSKSLIGYRYKIYIKLCEN